MLKTSAMRFNAYLCLQSALAVALGLYCAAADAEIRLVDDNGQTVVLKAPAQRIISLAPHVTELLYTAGAGERIVGAVEYSNYPESAKKIPRVGSNVQLDLERIVALKPDLIVVWMHGNAQRQLDQADEARHSGVLQRAAPAWRYRAIHRTIGSTCGHRDGCGAGGARICGARS